ncbi:MAG: hypothetical protein K5851_06875 [Lachnospiraceae bacterium]|nr:hypothetical protein [Lachnospiraceae bacterium]
MTEEAFKKTLSDLIATALNNQYSDPIHADLWQGIRIDLNEASYKLDEIKRK